MGYRARLGKIEKSVLIKYAGKTCDEVQEILGEDKWPAYPPEHTQLHELGKYVDYNDGRSPFYSFNIYDECESEFDILSKEGLKKVIEDYHSKIYKNYKEIEDSGDFRVFIHSMVNEWSRNAFDVQPYYLDQKNTDGEIVRSWKYEYAIFNLVYIYRTFDWENDYLIYSAW